MAEPLSSSGSDHEAEQIASAQVAQTVSTYREATKAHSLATEGGH
jgi:hypothetical protein